MNTSWQRRSASGTGVGPKSAANAKPTHAAGALAPVAREVGVPDLELRRLEEVAEAQTRAVDVPSSVYAFASPEWSPLASKVSITPGTSRSTCSLQFSESPPAYRRARSRPISAWARSASSPVASPPRTASSRYASAAAKSPVSTVASARSGSSSSRAGVAFGQQRDGAAEQVGGGAHVAAAERAPAGRRELLGRARPSSLPVVVERAELAQVPVRLLEVVAEDLLVLGLAAALAVDALGPVGEPLVEGGARPLEQAAVGRVADQHVVEAVALVVGDVRPSAGGRAACA